MKRGFTLIELLVVVLIIGVLSAVALPQYQKAVRRSHGAEALLMARSLSDALFRYYLANGSYEGVSADSLDIKVPASGYWKYGQVGTSLTTGTVGDDFPGCIVWVGNESQGYHWCGFSLQNRDAGVSIWAEIWKGGITHMNCKPAQADGKICDQFFSECSTALSNFGWVPHKVTCNFWPDSETNNI